jgi:hypothetical protein
VIKVVSLWGVYPHELLSAIAVIFLERRQRETGRAHRGKGTVKMGQRFKDNGL